MITRFLEQYLFFHNSYNTIWQNGMDRYKKYLYGEYAMRYNRANREAKRWSQIVSSETNGLPQSFPPASSPGACHRDKQRGCGRLERTRNRMFRLFHSSFNLSLKSSPPMKTFASPSWLSIAAPLCVLADHASLLSPDAFLSANECAVCQQSNGVKVCPACNGSGKFGNTTCINCGGKGIVRTNGQRL